MAKNSTDKQSSEAERLWHNCVHKNIGSFTMSQEKKAIEDITKFLQFHEQELASARSEVYETMNKQLKENDEKHEQELKEQKQKILIDFCKKIEAKAELMFTRDVDSFTEEKRFMIWLRDLEQLKKAEKID